MARPPSAPEALAITGTYGTGKSTLAGQLGDLLDARGVRYAAIDLDWLGWYHDQRPHPAGDWSMMRRNLASVVGNYRDAGVDRFVVAYALASPADRDRLAEALAMPLRTVELRVPIEAIERRLATDPSTGRREDVERARKWLATASDHLWADLVVDNERPITEVATELIEWLGWTD